MNYFAHGRDHLHDPYFLAGVSTPDWLSVIDRKTRARAKLAAPFANDNDPVVASVARGVLRHHHDDDWFHQSRAFAELNLEFTVIVRDALSPDGGFRPSFLGHILVEILLDAELIAAEPARLDAYYATMETLQGGRITAALNQMTTKPIDPERMSYFLNAFCREQFLYDYADDAKLLMRLNHVMRRVKLPALPEALQEQFPPHAKTHRRALARVAYTLAL